MARARAGGTTTGTATGLDAAGAPAPGAALGVPGAVLGVPGAALDDAAGAALGVPGVDPVPDAPAGAGEAGPLGDAPAGSSTITGLGLTLSRVLVPWLSTAKRQTSQAHSNTHAAHMRWAQRQSKKKKATVSLDEFGVKANVRTGDPASRQSAFSRRHPVRPGKYVLQHACTLPFSFFLL